MNKPNKILIQRLQENSPEARAAIQYSMLEDCTYSYIESPVEPHTFSEDTLIIGSVEFIVEQFDVLNLEPPYHNLSCYPRELRPYFNRRIRSMIYQEYLDRYHSSPNKDFIKPTTPKQFEANNPPDDLDPFTRIWVSEWVEWESEHRFYVQEGKIVGLAQYTGEDDYVFTDYELLHVKEIIDNWKKAPSAYAFDIGVREDGTLDIVEITDAWATGEYQWGIGSKAYINWLWIRWQDLIKIPKKERIHHQVTIDELTRYA